ncbi:MAG: RluA family pseudouridine synthase [Polyangiaceae bacterium]|nr:RluA family pseudouridine synthase [Polyangiaceae bacterium]
MPYTFVLPPEQTKERIDRIVADLLGDVSRATVQRWIGDGRVLLDGKRCKQRDVVGPGMRIDVEPGPRPSTNAEPDPSVAFGVVYEDEHLIVVDKPAGLVVHPARGHWTGTLVNGLLARPGFASPPADPRDPVGALRPGVVHRLDRDTSGLLVVAKDEPTREALKRQIQARSVERVYCAIVVGVPESGMIESLYGRHPQSRLRFTSRVQSGRSARTAVLVRERLAGGSAALVECRLETGRTHQIRVHMAEQVGAPVLGDPLYGGRSYGEPIDTIAKELGRQALHAARLGFVHPITAERLRLESPMPEDMRRALSRMRGEL